MSALDETERGPHGAPAANEGDGDTTALVVGGGTGIGLACARTLVARGVAVMITGRRESKLKEAAAEIERERAGSCVAWRGADAGVAREAEATVAEAVERFGQLDIVVNAAGVYVTCAFEDLTEQAWRETMSSTLDAMAYVSISAAQQMIKQRRGRLILMSSINDPLSGPRAAAYNAAKAATSSLVRSMAVDLARFNIQANAVAPGTIDTDMAWVATMTSEELRWSSAYARAGTPDDIANVTAYLALDAPSFLTGQTITVDGGKTIMSRPT